MRAGVGAVLLGDFAIGFQFLGFTLGVILFVILVGAVLAQQGFS